MIVGIAINRFLPEGESWEEAEDGMKKYVTEVLLVDHAGARLNSLGMYRDSWLRNGREVRRLNGMAELVYGENNV